MLMLTTYARFYKKADVEQAYINHNTYEVMSNGRLYFNSAPSNECKVKGVFLIPGDKVIGYTEYNGFSSVAYFKKNGDSVDGWLDVTQLKDTGLTNGPSGEEQMAFNMIPDVVAKNKLTSLKDKCLNFNMDDKDKKYYTVIISRASDESCASSDELPFTVLIKKGTLEIYTNQGAKSDEFCSLNTK